MVIQLKKKKGCVWKDRIWSLRELINELLYRVRKSANAKLGDTIAN